MEIWDILDENAHKTGKTIERGQAMQPGDYHMVVFVWLKHSNGKYLISKRSPYKKWPGMWETVGGAVISGENSLQAALREVKEELGVQLDPMNGRHISRHKFSAEHGWFADIWLFEQDIHMSEVVRQQEEVAEVKWATEAEIRNMIEEGIFFQGDLYVETVFSKLHKKSKNEKGGVQ